MHCIFKRNDNGCSFSFIFMYCYIVDKEPTNCLASRLVLRYMLDQCLAFRKSMTSCPEISFYAYAQIAFNSISFDHFYLMTNFILTLIP